MKDITEIRKDNLRELLGRYEGRIVALAEAIGKSQSLVTQWLSSKTNKPMSNDSARDIERALGLPYAWMDNVQHDSQIPLILRDVIICTEQAIRQEGIRHLTPEKKADLILAFAAFFTPEHPPNVAAIRGFLRAKM